MAQIKKKNKNEQTQNHLLDSQPTARVRNQILRDLLEQRTATKTKIDFSQPEFSGHNFQGGGELNDVITA